MKNLIIAILLVFTSCVTLIKHAPPTLIVSAPNSVVNAPLANILNKAVSNSELTSYDIGRVNISINNGVIDTLFTVELKKDSTVRVDLVGKNLKQITIPRY